MSDRVTVTVYPWQEGKSKFNPLWTKVRVRKSLDEICHTIEVTMPPSEHKRINEHDTIQVRLANDVVPQGRPVSTGLIDDVDLECSAKRRSTIVTARSPARDIIDSTWSVTKLPSQQLSKAIMAICKIDGKIGRKPILNYGEEYLTAFVSNYKNRPDPTETVADLAWENESPWPKLIQECDNQGYIVTSDQAGILCIQKIKAGERPEGFRIDESNCLEIRHKKSGSGQFRKYIFSGTCGGNNKTVEMVDASCRPGRILTVNLTDPNLTEDKLKRRVQTEMRRRKSRRPTVTVQSWGLSEARLRQLGNLDGLEIFWDVNYLTPVKLPLLDIDDKLLTSAVEYVADSKETRCTIELANREEYL